MGRKRRFSSKQAGEIARLYEEDGLTMAQLAEMFSAHSGVIRNSLLRSGVTPRPRSTPLPESEWIFCECGERAEYKSGLCRMCYSRERNRRTTANGTKFNWTLRKRWNLSREDYDLLLKAQDGACGICRQPPPDGRRLAIDHDHRCCPEPPICGKCVRGLLCVACNTAMGSLGEDPERARNLIAYIARFQRSESPVTRGNTF